jgi:hypothetical protein
LASLFRFAVLQTSLGTAFALYRNNHIIYNNMPFIIYPFSYKTNNINLNDVPLMDTQSKGLTYQVFAETPLYDWTLKTVYGIVSYFSSTPGKAWSALSAIPFSSP